MAGPHLAALGLQTITVEEHGLYPVLLQLIAEKNITASHLTLGLVAEMVSLVFVTINTPNGFLKILLQQL